MNSHFFIGHTDAADTELAERLEAWLGRRYTSKRPWPKTTWTRPRRSRSETVHPKPQATVLAPGHGSFKAKKETEIHW